MLNENEKPFFADWNELDKEKYCVFKYYFETREDVKEAAAHLCREQSTILWKRGDVDEDFRDIHGAKVISIEVVGRTDTPAIPNSDNKGWYSCVEVEIAHPHINFGSRIPNLITAACGEGAFFTPGIDSIKLLDIRFPDNYLKRFGGPRFGIDGIRTILGVKDRPLICGVVKPNIGLRPKEFAELAYKAYLGGVDATKDDEMLADAQYNTIEERVSAVIEVMHKAEDKTGEKKMFIANITDEVDKILELHDLVVELGGNGVMLNSMAVGLSAARMLAKSTKVPMFSHFDFIAPFSRHPKFGVATQVITKLQRISGFDGIVMPGLGGRMKTPNNEVRDNVDLCLNKFGDIKTTLPIPGGSDWAGSLKGMYETFKTKDFSMVPGRGIFGHPNGPEAGARSIRQAWEAIEQDIEIAEYSKTHTELEKAIDAFGS